MNPVIEQLTSYIGKLHSTQAKPFFLLVTDEFRCVEWSGPATHYGFDSPSRGDDLSDKVLFLVGLEESEMPSLQLPFLDIGYNGITAQVHVVRMRDGWGLAFLDVTQEKDARHHYQQTAHQLQLLQSSQNRLLDYLTTAHTQLETQKGELEKNCQLKSHFVGRMSHEFRTPLSSILGFVDLARDDLSNPERLLSDLQAIERSSNYLLNLVDNLLDQAVLENGKLAIHPSACDLHALTEDLEQLFQPMAQQKGLRLAWWNGSNTPPRVWLDEIRLRQVIINLLTNAIKFTPDGSVTVSLSWHEDRLSVTVEDTGSGIPAEVAESIFEAFNQGQGGSKKRGAGLGLSISQEIVRRMGGTLQIGNITPHGTAARFDVPAPARSPSEDSSVSLKGVKLLLIEPDEDNRRLLNIYLESAGSELHHCKDFSCLQQSLSKFTPELILATVDKNGDSAGLNVQQVRATGFQGDMIAITLSKNAGIHQRILQAGFKDVVTRPIRYNTLVETLNDVLANQ